MTLHVITAPDGTVIDMRRTWEINCLDCGVIDQVPTKREAMQIAKRHAKKHKADGVVRWQA